MASNFATLPSIVQSEKSNGASPHCSESDSRYQPQMKHGSIASTDDRASGEKSEDGITEPSFKFSSSQASFGDQQKTVNHNQLFPDSVTYLSIASILGGLIISAVLAAGHHLFLSFLHNRNIDSFSQFWVKGVSNGFATLFSVCLGFGATSALTQTVRMPNSSFVLD